MLTGHFATAVAWHHAVASSSWPLLTHLSQACSIVCYCSRTLSKPSPASGHHQKFQAGRHETRNCRSCGGQTCLRGILDLDACCLSFRCSQSESGSSGSGSSTFSVEVETGDVGLSFLALAASWSCQSVVFRGLCGRPSWHTGLDSDRSFSFHREVLQVRDSRSSKLKPCLISSIFSLELEPRSLASCSLTLRLSTFADHLRMPSFTIASFSWLLRQSATQAGCHEPACWTTWQNATGPHLTGIGPRILQHPQCVLMVLQGRLR